MSTPLTFEEAVHLFEQWGFQVEPGPGEDEVTLILETPESCTHAVQPRRMLPQIAAVSLAVRWENRNVTCWTGLAKGVALPV